jgi:riboflavin synthase
MRADTRFSGHFVQGHVDTTAEVIRYAQHGQDHEFTIRIPAGGRNFLLHKGSICLDGMSLTVAELQQEQLTIWITPHTHSVTTLQHLQAGARVNVEYDMFAKYLDKMLAARQAD